MKGLCIIVALAYFGPFAINGQDGCVPYSKNACRDAATRLGLKLGGSGKTFEGNYVTKGCYAYTNENKKYKGKVYYGTGGSDTEMKKAATGSGQYRPKGYDCLSVAQCDWKYRATNQDNLVQCMDGTYCYWDFTNDVTASETTKCCNGRRGRRTCPKNFPAMCASMTCGGGKESCCEASKYYCDILYPNEPGLRACENEPIVN